MTTIICPLCPVYLECVLSLRRPLPFNTGGLQRMDRQMDGRTNIAKRLQYNPPPKTKIKPTYESQKTEDINHHAMKGVKQTNASESPNTKFNTVMITMMVILLLITFISIALSGTTFNRLASKHL